MALTKMKEASPSTVVARWQRSFATRLFVTDLVVIGATVYGSQLLRFGTENVALNSPSSGILSFDLSYTLVSLVLIFAWMISLEFFATRDHKVIGSGTLEYKRIVDATIRV